ncbi:MAG: hypothetical protein HOI23_07860, partial [Deltaproteobacteria bacterium]|nr:hypothetical protein [Deltaproteobacteria bacterium]
MPILFRYRMRQQRPLYWRHPMNKPKSPLGANLKHESAHLHVSGEARYVDDFPLVPGLLHAQIVSSPIASGALKSIDVEAARGVHGVVTVLTADD